MPQFPLFDPSLYHGDPPVDPNYPPTEIPAALSPSAAVSGSEGESPSDGTDGAAEAAAEASLPAYEDMTVEQLRDDARERGVSYSGLNKADLIAALEADDAADEG
jgi:hypothetical protein